MSRVTIRRFDIIRAANVVAALYAVVVAIFGLLIVLPIALLGGFAGMRGDAGSGLGVFGAGLVGGLIFTLIGILVYGILGWIMTAIVVALYNVVAGRIGGIQADVEITGFYGAPGYGGPGYPMQPANPTWPAPGGPSAPPPGWGPPR